MILQIQKDLMDLKRKVNKLLCSLTGDCAIPEDYTDSATYNNETQVATFNRILGGSYDLNLDPLNTRAYTGSSGPELDAWTMENLGKVMFWLDGIHIYWYSYGFSEWVKIIDSIAIAEIIPYKKYTALLNQTGASAPTATVLENTLGVTPTFTYNDVGEYVINTITAFPNNKTSFIFGNTVDLKADLNSYTGTNTLDIFTRDNSNVLANNILVNTFIEIRVYN